MPTLTTPECFVCHASIDKGDVVEPLAKVLARRGPRIFYDDLSIGDGEDFLRAILDGARRATHAVAIISHAFIGRTIPEWELGLLRHLANDDRLIPVFHNIEPDSLPRHYGFIASRKGPKSSDGVQAIARRILERMYPPTLPLPPIQVVTDLPLDERPGGLESIDGRGVAWKHIGIINTSPTTLESVRIEVFSTEPREIEEKERFPFLQARSTRRAQVNIPAGNQEEFDIAHIQRAGDYSRETLRIQHVSGNGERNHSTLCRLHEVDHGRDALIKVWVSSGSGQFCRQGMFIVGTSTGGNLEVDFKWNS